MRKTENRGRAARNLPGSIAGTVAGGNRKPGTLPQETDAPDTKRHSGTVATQFSVPGTGNSTPTRRSGGTVC